MSAINFMTNPDSLSKVQLSGVQVEESSTPVKPRRRLGDSKEDDAIGGLIQKTRAIELSTGEDLVRLLPSYLFFKAYKWARD